MNRKQVVTRSAIIKVASYTVLIGGALFVIVSIMLIARTERATSQILEQVVRNQYEMMNEAYKNGIKKGCPACDCVKETAAIEKTSP